MIKIQWTDHVTEHYEIVVPLETVLAALNADLAPDEKPYTVDDVEQAQFLPPLSMFDGYLADQSDPKNRTDSVVYRELDSIKVIRETQ